MKTVKYDIYKALDHLYLEPENPVWKDIINDGLSIGLRLVNPIIVKQHSYVVAVSECNPFRESYLMVYGKYACLPMLLKKVAAVNIKLNNFNH